MTDTAVLSLIGVISVALIAGFFGLRAAMVTAKVSKEGNVGTFAKLLLERVESLEDDVKEVKRDLSQMTRVFSTALNFIERFLLWAQDGSKPPIPDVPESLREHLDNHLIREHKRQQDRINPVDADPN